VGSLDGDWLLEYTNLEVPRKKGYRKKSATDGKGAAEPLRGPGKGDGEEALAKLNKPRKFPFVICQ